MCSSSWRTSRDANCNGVRARSLPAGVNLLAAISVLCGAIQFLAAAPPSPPVVDERWKVTVNGQTIRVDADGSFRLPDIAAADLFGATGPGSAPDFKSDEWFQVVGTATIDGVTWYAYSEPFQITSDQQTGDPQTYSVLTLPVTRRAPADIPESIAIEVVTALQDDTLYIDGLGGPGSTPIRVWGNFAGVDEPREVTAGGGTTYRTSNRRVLDVDEFGGQVIVTARGIGTGFITATNRGATAVQRFVVTTPCVDTLLVGRVVDSGGFPVQGAIVSTEGGSNASTGTNASGEFSFNVCYTPGTPFSVVVVGPVAGQKAVLTDIAPVPDGVTDVGTITLEGNLVFWNLNGTGGWGSPPGSSSTNWHTGTVPDAASHVFVNIEDRVSVPVNPYTVSMPPVSNVTVSSFTLDSPHATIATIYPGFQLIVTDTARFLDGMVEWRIAGWQGGSFINDAEVRFFGSCSMVGGMDAVNNGLMRVEFDSNNGSLSVQGTGTTFTQGSTLDDLVLEGEMHIRQAATLTTTPTCRGISIETSGLLEIRESSGGVLSVFNHNGGTITLHNSPPAQGNGLKVNSGGTFNVNGGVIDIGPTGSLEVLSATANFNDGVINNAGLLKVHASGAFNYNGGTIVGDGSDGKGIFFDRGTLRLGPSATAPAKFRFRHLNTVARPDGSPLTIASGQTLLIEGAGIDTQNQQDRGIVTTPNDLTNYGTIILDSVIPQQFSTPASAKLTVQNDRTLTNRGEMQCVVGVGQGSDRLLDTRYFVNEGTLSVLTATVIFYNQLDDVTYTNLGRIDLANNAVLQFTPKETGDCIAFTNATNGPQVGVIAGFGTFDVGIEAFCGMSGERTFENRGIMEPGGMQTTGTINVAGQYVQTATGVLNIELSGTGAGQYDKLAVTQQATLGGTMNVTLLAGYTPAAGHSFDVVAYATRSGTFSTINLPPLGGGLTWQTTYMATSLRLTVASASATRPPIDHRKRDRRGVKR